MSLDGVVVVVLMADLGAGWAAPDVSEVVTVSTGFKSPCARPSRLCRRFPAIGKGFGCSASTKHTCQGSRGRCRVLTKQDVRRA